MRIEDAEQAVGELAVGDDRGRGSRMRIAVVDAAVIGVSSLHPAMIEGAEQAVGELAVGEDQGRGASGG